MSVSKVVVGLTALEVKGVAQDNKKILAKKEVIGVEKYGAEKNNCEKLGHDKGIDKGYDKSRDGGDLRFSSTVLGGVFKYEAQLAKKT